MRGGAGPAVEVKGAEEVMRRRDHFEERGYYPCMIRDSLSTLAIAGGLVLLGCDPAEPRADVGPEPADDACACMEPTEQGHAYTCGPTRDCGTYVIHEFSSDEAPEPPGNADVVACVLDAVAGAEPLSFREHFIGELDVNSSYVRSYWLPGDGLMFTRWELTSAGKERWADAYEEPDLTSCANWSCVAAEIANAAYRQYCLSEDEHPS